ncbi:hypothetical protein FH972_017509 [Carpinus fangiana]|uniref:Uncharacterized protein n=1 Tax=Carpinus fangiana TaxID=176857 RepID=A0A5N6RKH6_9ROSI|nr:hypothetical protein FH972_017509 [Carpinus fangiana]
MASSSGHASTNSSDSSDYKSGGRHRHHGLRKRSNQGPMKVGANPSMWATHSILREAELTEDGSLTAQLDKVGRNCRVIEKQK